MKSLKKMWAGLAVSALAIAGVAAGIEPASADEGGFQPTPQTPVYPDGDWVPQVGSISDYGKPIYPGSDAYMWGFANTAGITADATGFNLPEIYKGQHLYIWVYNDYKTDPILISTDWYQNGHVNANMGALPGTHIVGFYNLDGMLIGRATVNFGGEAPQLAKEAPKTAAPVAAPTAGPVRVSTESQPILQVGAPVNVVANGKFIEQRAVQFDANGKFVMVEGVSGLIALQDPATGWAYLYATV